MSDEVKASSEGECGVKCTRRRPCDDHEVGGVTCEVLKTALAATESEVNRRYIAAGCKEDYSFGSDNFVGVLFDVLKDARR